MAIQVIDNFLNEEEFNNLSSFVMGDNFPWYYNDFVTENLDNKFYLTHTFYREPADLSNWFNSCLPILKKLNCKSVMRIKANTYFRSNKKEKNKEHTDYPFKHKGCLLYMNDNNGSTYFKDKTVNPKTNRAVLFDPSVPHASSLCSDNKRRVTININYF
jgi:hypothetical protein